jgi:hypothetical protein
VTHALGMEPRNLRKGYWGVKYSFGHSFGICSYVVGVAKECGVCAV